MLTKTQKQFLHSFLNAIEFRFTINTDTLVGYIVIQGTPDELTQFLNELRKINDCLAEELSTENPVKEVIWENEKVDSSGN